MKVRITFLSLGALQGLIPKLRAVRSPRRKSSSHVPVSPLARTPSPTSASPSHPHNLSHQARSTSPLTLRGSSASPHLATITPQTSPRPGSPLLRRALSPEHFQLGKQDKKVRRSSREERRSLGRQNSFEFKGRHRKHDLYQGVRCVVEQESVVQRSRSTSLNETNSQHELSPRLELRRRSEEYRRFVSLKSEPKDCAEENSEEAERDTKLWPVGLSQLVCRSFALSGVNYFLCLLRRKLHLFHQRISYISSSWLIGAGLTTVKSL